MVADKDCAAKAFEFSYGLTDEEIKVFGRMVHQKQMKIAPLGRYIGWIFIAIGVAVAYYGGAIAHSYYGVPLNSNTTTLVMALFAAFFSGASAYQLLLSAWYKRISVWRRKRHKETVRLKMDKDGLTLSRANASWAGSWEAIEDVTFASGSVLLWYGGETGFFLPLRVFPSTEERSAFIESVKEWSKARS